MDYFDNYDADDLFDDDNENNLEHFHALLKKLSEELNIEEFIEKEKEQQIRLNYDMIKSKGINVIELKEYGEDNFNRLKYTINEMLLFFEDVEEFEKCAELKSLQKQLDKVTF